MKSSSDNNTNDQEELKPKDVKVEDLPEVRAFEDEFTRGFLQSTKETRSGYYPFLSGTGAFTMDLSKNAWIGEKSYRLKEDHFEYILIDVVDKETNIIHNINVKYTGHLEEDLHKETSLGMLHSNIKEDLNFERKEEENQIYYISEFSLEKEEGQPENYGYASFIFNNQGQGGIEVIYNSYCKENCEGLKKPDKEAIYDWIMSIKFLEESVGSDENDE